MKWEFKLLSPPWAGVLSTVSGLVFSGSDEGTFYALDAQAWQTAMGFSDRRGHRRQPRVVH